MGSYICIEGPQFSSKAESEIYRGFGASVIGMTNVPEAYLALKKQVLPMQQLRWLQTMIAGKKSIVRLKRS